MADRVLGCFVVRLFDAALPHLLVIAASGLVCVAVADLIPPPQRRLAWRDTAIQRLRLAVFQALTTVLSGLTHHRRHDAGRKEAAPPL